MESKKRNNKNSYDSTTDFFLKVMQKEKERTLKEEPKKDNINYNKTLDTVLRFYNYLNQSIDKILASKISVMLLSLIMAISLFLGISGGDILTSPTSGTTLESVPVMVKGLDENLELSGLDETVTVGLIGPSLDIYSTKISKNYSVFVDLTKLEKGDYTLTLQSQGFADTLTVMVVPDTVTVRLSEKVRESFTLEYDFINEDKLDQKYSVSVKHSDIDNVSIYASRETLNKIDRVVAYIDVENKTKDFTQSAQIKALDELGNVLDVAITPTHATVECSVASYSREVPIQVTFNGEVSSGYQIANYGLSQSTVTIYGLKENIDNIATVNVYVDVDGLKQSISINDLKLNPVNGVNKMSVDAVNVNVKVEKIITKEFDNIEIKVLNNSSSNKVSFVGQSGVAKVMVRGIESKISALTPENIQATVDVNGLSRGTRKVNVKVAVDDDALTIELLSSASVSVNIERK